jgi:glucosamine--fructose-6-phosphate aminotransferase (isomerizing)
MAIVRLHKPLKIRKIKDDSLVDPYVQELQMNLEQIEKGGYDHFMLKEIYEQPNVIKDCTEEDSCQSRELFKWLVLKII